MKTITKYQADDNVEFLTSKDCIEHEYRCAIAKSIMIGLESNSCFDMNDERYIQHDGVNLLKIRNYFLQLCKKYTDHDWIQKTIDAGLECDPSWAGRIMGEVLPNSIYAHWHRFSCIDKQFREWQQPYYVENTPENPIEIKR